METATLSEAPVLLPKAAPLDRIALGTLPARPLVSVIVPSFNQGQFIRDTIDSILSQDYRPIEIQIIDGGSKDQTVDVLKSYGSIPELKWVSERDKGVVHAVNKGFARVTGDIVAIQSSDDMYTPGAIGRVIEEFARRPSTGLIYGDTVKVDAQGAELSRHTLGPFSLENVFLFKTWIPQPSAFFRREMLDVLGGWDERIPYAPDTDLWIRMAFRTDVVKLDDFLSQRRMHEAQRDTQKAKIVRDYRQMVEQSPDIRQAPARIRSAARAGAELIAMRYSTLDPQTLAHYWAAARTEMRAGLIDSRAFSLPRWWSNAVVFPARIMLRPLKRAVTGSKQAAGG